MGITDHRGLGRLCMSLIFIVAGITQINEFEEMRKVIWCVVDDPSGYF
jgi:hypothetical protein